VLPGELDLAERLNLSRHTVRHALSVLAAEGLLRRERGRGTLVLPAPIQSVIERSLGTFYAFAWEVSARGVEQQSHILELATVVAPADIAERLALGANREVRRIVRVRTAGGDPLTLETAYLPAPLAECLTAAVLEHGSVYDELERHHRLRVTMERTTWSDRGPIEWQESLVRGDRYLYSVELPRTDLHRPSALQLALSRTAG
jgi:DNA-binding GntR family transcriptional regulator